MNKNRESEARTQTACCNIYNADKKIVLQLEMPGVGKSDLDVRIENNLLKIHGTRKKYDENEKFLIREIRSDDYYQEFTIDDTIDREKVSASITQGMVNIELQLKESVLPRKIEIT